jgi:hypothetical protein
MIKLKAYNQSLEDALLAYMQGDEDQFVSHCKRYDVSLPENELARRGAVMKTITAKTNLPIEIRRQAKQWLTDRGFQSWDDGDV